MVRHKNPYNINDPHDWLEVSENSSHPELKDAQRVYRFGGYTFQSGTEVQRFFDAEGLKLSDYSIEPVIYKEYAKNKIVINIVEKYQSRNYRALRSL